MASYRAIAAVSEAIIHLLESQYVIQDFDGNQLQFQVYSGKDFEEPMEAGVSLFLYRIYVNGTQRTPPGRVALDGRRYRTQLPVDLHFLLTAWAKDASLQHTIGGWMMRVMEDTPSLPIGLLNHNIPDVFRVQETVEVNLAELTTEEMFHIWEVVGNNTYHISIPYVARNVRIESRQLLSSGKPVQERTLDVQKLDNP